MKNKYIFWGSFLISLGLLILLKNFSLYIFNSSMILTWFPLLLILWGISLLKISELFKSIIISLTGIFTALVIMAFFTKGNEVYTDFKNNIIINDNDFDENGNCTSFEKDIEPAIKYAKLNFSGGAGKFDFNSTGEYLYYLKSGSEDCDVVIDKPNDSTLVINYSFDENSNPSTNRYLQFDLNKSLIWDINISGGAAKMDLDFSKIIVSHLNIDVGASDTELKLGDNIKQSKVNINCGAANFKIEIPNRVGSSIEGDMALTKYDFKGIKKNSAGVFISNNYYKSNNKIDFYIDGTLSKVQLTRK